MALNSGILTDKGGERCMKTKMSEFDWAAWVFVTVGALNWGLVGAFKMDLVQIIFSTSPMLMKLVYILIGLSGLYWLYKILIAKK